VGAIIVRAYISIKQK